MYLMDGILENVLSYKKMTKNITQLFIKKVTFYQRALSKMAVHCPQATLG